MLFERQSVGALHELPLVLTCGFSALNTSRYALAGASLPTCTLSRFQARNLDNILHGFAQKL